MKRGNITFNDLYLEEIEKTNIVESKERMSTWSKRHSRQIYLKKKNSHRNIQMQHNGWKYFQKECKRYEINEDDSKIRILRLFLDRACSDWYLETFEVLTMEAGWSEWKRDFWIHLQTEDGVQI